MEPGVVVPFEDEPETPTWIYSRGDLKKGLDSFIWLVREKGWPQWQYNIWNNLYFNRNNHVGSVI